MRQAPEGVEGVHMPMKFSTKPPATMAAREVNEELDALDARDSVLTQAFIDAGRGHETFRDHERQTDPLALEHQAILARRSDLSDEIAERMGYGLTGRGGTVPRRLPPRGYPPREKAAAKVKAAPVETMTEQAWIEMERARQDAIKDLSNVPMADLTTKIEAWPEGTKLSKGDSGFGILGGLIALVTYPEPVRPEGFSMTSVAVDAAYRPRVQQRVTYFQDRHGRPADASMTTHVAWVFEEGATHGYNSNYKTYEIRDYSRGFKLDLAVLFPDRTIERTLDPFALDANDRILSDLYHTMEGAGFDEASRSQEKLTQAEAEIIMSYPDYESLEAAQSVWAKLTKKDPAAILNAHERLFRGKPTGPGLYQFSGKRTLKILAPRTATARTTTSVTAPVADGEHFGDLRGAQDNLYRAGWREITRSGSVGKVARIEFVNQFTGEHGYLSPGTTSGWAWDFTAPAGWRERLRAVEVASQAPAPTTITIADDPPDRAHVPLDDLLADYKFRGLDAQKAYNELIKDRRLAPDIGLKDLLARYATIPHRRLGGGTRRVEFEATHFDSFTSQRVQISKTPGGWWSLVWESGMTGTEPHPLSDRYTLLTGSTAQEPTATPSGHSTAPNDVRLAKTCKVPEDWTLVNEVTAQRIEEEFTAKPEYDHRITWDAPRPKFGSTRIHLTRVGGRWKVGIEPGTGAIIPVNIPDEARGSAAEAVAAAIPILQRLGNTKPPEEPAPAANMSAPLQPSSPALVWRVSPDDSEMWTAKIPGTDQHYTVFTSGDRTYLRRDLDAGGTVESYTTLQIGDRAGLAAGMHAVEQHHENAQQPVVKEESFGALLNKQRDAARKLGSVALDAAIDQIERYVSAKGWKVPVGMSAKLVFLARDHHLREEKDLAGGYTQALAYLERVEEEFAKGGARYRTWEAVWKKQQADAADVSVNTPAVPNVPAPVSTVPGDEPEPPQFKVGDAVQDTDIPDRFGNVEEYVGYDSSLGTHKYKVREGNRRVTWNESSMAKIEDGQPDELETEGHGVEEWVGAFHDYLTTERYERAFLKNPPPGGFPEDSKGLVQKTTAGTLAEYKAAAWVLHGLPDTRSWLVEHKRVPAATTVESIAADYKVDLPIGTPLASHLKTDASIQDWILGQLPKGSGATCTVNGNKWEISIPHPYNAQPVVTLKATVPTGDRGPAALLRFLGNADVWRRIWEWRLRPYGIVLTKPLTAEDEERVWAGPDDTLSAGTPKKLDKGIGRPIRMARAIMPFGLELGGRYDERDMDEIRELLTTAQSRMADLAETLGYDEGLTAKQRDEIDRLLEPLIEDYRLLRQEFYRITGEDIGPLTEDGDEESGGHGPNFIAYIDPKTVGLFGGKPSVTSSTPAPSLFGAAVVVEEAERPVLPAPAYKAEIIARDALTLMVRVVTPTKSRFIVVATIPREVDGITGAPYARIASGITVDGEEIDGTDEERTAVRTAARELLDVDAFLQKLPVHHYTSAEYGQILKALDLEMDDDVVLRNWLAALKVATAAGEKIPPVVREEYEGKTTITAIASSEGYEDLPFGWTYTESEPRRPEYITPDAIYRVDVTEGFGSNERSTYQLIKWSRDRSVRVLGYVDHGGYLKREAPIPFKSASAAMTAGYLRFAMDAREAAAAIPASTTTAAPTPTTTAAPTPTPTPPPAKPLTDDDRKALTRVMEGRKVLPREIPSLLTLLGVKLTHPAGAGNPTLQTAEGALFVVTPQRKTRDWTRHPVDGEDIFKLSYEYDWKIPDRLDPRVDRAAYIDKQEAIGKAEKKRRREQIALWKTQAEALLNAAAPDDTIGAAGRALLAKFVKRIDLPNKDLSEVLKILGFNGTLADLVHLRPEPGAGWEARADFDARHADENKRREAKWVELRESAREMLGLPPEDPDAPAYSRNALTDFTIRTCQACFRDIKVTDAIDGGGRLTKVMVHHGYQRPGTGETIGKCPGVGQQPYEHSRDLLIGSLEDRLKNSAKALVGLRKLVFEQPPLTYPARVGTGEEIRTATAEGDAYVYKQVYNRDQNRARVALRHDWSGGYDSIPWLRHAIEVWERWPDDKAMRGAPLARRDATLARHGQDAPTAEVGRLAALPFVEGLGSFRRWLVEDDHERRQPPGLDHVAFRKAFAHAPERMDRLLRRLIAKG